MKDNRFSSKRLEEAAKTHDVIQRAKAAQPIDAGRDRLTFAERCTAYSKLHATDLL